MNVGLRWLQFARRSLPFVDLTLLISARKRDVDIPQLVLSVEYQKTGLTMSHFSVDN